VSNNNILIIRMVDGFIGLYRCTLNVKEEMKWYYTSRDTTRLQTLASFANKQFPEA
jgi:hypothetical protein